MSRDWTPQEHLAVEQWNIEHGHGSIWDFMSNSFWELEDRREPLFTSEEIALRKEFPLLGKLLGSGDGGFEQVYQQLSSIKGGIELLHEKDNELAQYVETPYGNDLSDVVRWFKGELDQGFYYREYNDKLFAESLLDEARERAREGTALDDRIDAAEARKAPISEMKDRNEQER